MSKNELRSIMSFKRLEKNKFIWKTNKANNVKHSLKIELSKSFETL